MHNIVSRIRDKKNHVSIISFTEIGNNQAKLIYFLRYYIMRKIK